MWIVKGFLGVLLGIVFFIVGGLSYIYIRIRLGMYHYAQAVKAGRSTHGILPYYSLFGGGSSDLSRDPRFWITLVAAIAVGLWIMRARKTRTV